MFYEGLSKEIVNRVRNLNFQFQVISPYDPSLLSHGLFRTEINDGYQDLFTLIDINLVGYLANRIVDQGMLRILDVGCGKGNYLKDCLDLAKGKISCAGIDAVARFAERRFESLDLRVGDVHQLQREYQDERFGLITSVLVAHHLADPMSMLEGIYNLLEPDGLALIYKFPFRFKDHRQVQLFRNYLERKYQIRSVRDKGSFPTWDDFHLVFRRTAPKMELPIEYESVYDYPPQNPKLVYRLI